MAGHVAPDMIGNYAQHGPPASRYSRELAAPLAPSQRSAFLKDVARRLHNVELGDGAVALAAREAQAAIRKASPWLQA
jgi:hypothetical protein